MKTTQLALSIYLRLLGGLAALVVGLLCATRASATSVVGLWRFNEGTGTNVADSSGLGNNGTLQSLNTTLPVWTNSKSGLGNALYFHNDGTNYDYVNVPASASLQIGLTATNTWSVTAWAYEMSNGTNDFEATYGRILVLDNGVAFQLESGASGDDTFYTWDRTTNSAWQIGWGAPTAPLLDQWEHVAVVYDGTNVYFYLNGNQGANGAVASQPIMAALGYAGYQGAVQIGTELSQPGNRNWNGLLDDVAIFNGPLSQSQIQLIMTGDFSDFIGGPLTILAPPQAQTVPAGGTAAFIVGASGSNLHYQWYLNSTTKLDNQTNNTLTIPDAQASDDGLYSVIVSNAGTAYTSPPVRLLVYDPNTKLVALWRFNEGSGSMAADSSGLGNDGTLVGPEIGWAQSQTGFGTALSITNDDQNMPYVNVPGNQSLMIGMTVTNPWTITAWAYENSDGAGDYIANYGRILVIDDGTALQLESGAPGDGEFYTWDRTATNFELGWGIGNSVSPLLDQWEHWAVVYDGAKITLYRDGNQGANGGVASIATMQALSYAGYQGAIHIASELDSDPTRTWNGMLDDIAIFNAALTQSQVQTIMSGDFSAFLPQASLSINSGANSITLSWPSSFGNLHLESKTDLNASSWGNVTAPLTTNGSVITATIPVGSGNQFYRLASH